MEIIAPLLFLRRPNSEQTLFRASFSSGEVTWLIEYYFLETNYAFNFANASGATKAHTSRSKIKSNALDYKNPDLHSAEQTNRQRVVFVPHFLVFNILCLSDYAVVFYSPKSQ